MRTRLPVRLVLLPALALAAPARAQEPAPRPDTVAAAPLPRPPVPRDAYYPGPGDRWERRAPRQVGMDSARLAEAVAFAVARESRANRDLEAAHWQGFGREPFGAPVGPFGRRGAPSGVVLRHGYLVAEWGDTEAVEMTFSVTKSFLSAVVGLALDDGRIASVHDRVAPSQAPVWALPAEGAPRPRTALGGDSLLRPFDTPHNRRITWDDLLRQTSDFEGTLWGKPEWADRPSGPASEWATRARLAPGSAYEYNDVRVNALALAATQVWRRPLPEVLRERIMEPIGASPTWRWTGYENAWIVLDGRPVQAVSGGGHWGGGMFIHARDLARFGYLTLRRGRWGDRQLLSEAFVRRALTPTPAEPGYGYMNWFLNTGRRRFPSAPETAYAHLGNGTNLVYVDPEHDLVVVARWIENDQLDAFVGRVLAAVERR